MSGAAEIDEYLEAVRIAASLPGPTVVRVVCYACGRSGRSGSLATVRSTAAGLLYESTFVDADFHAAFHEATRGSREKYRAVTGSRTPAAEVTVRILLDRPHPDGWLPRTRCPRRDHGDAVLTIQELTEAARRTRRAAEPTVVKVNKHPR